MYTVTLSVMQMQWIKCRFETNYNFGKIVYKMIKNKIKTKNYYKWQDERLRMWLKRDATDPLNSLYFNRVKILSLPFNKCLPPWPFSRSGVPVHAAWLNFRACSLLIWHACHTFILVWIEINQWCSKLDNWGEGAILIYSCSALLISFEIYCFYGLWTWIYEYCPPPPPPPLAPNYRVCYATEINSRFVSVSKPKKNFSCYLMYTETINKSIYFTIGLYCNTWQSKVSMRRLTDTFTYDDQFDILLKACKTIDKCEKNIVWPWANKCTFIVLIHFAKYEGKY